MGADNQGDRELLLGMRNSQRSTSVGGLRTGDWSTSPSPYKLLRDEVTVVGRLVMRGMHIVVPLSLRERVLELAHEGHQGIVKTKDRLRSKVWWPSMTAIVERHDSCYHHTSCEDNNHANQANQALEGPCRRFNGSTTDRIEPACHC